MLFVGELKNISMIKPGLGHLAGHVQHYSKTAKMQNDRQPIHSLPLPNEWAMPVIYGKEYSLCPIQNQLPAWIDQRCMSFGEICIFPCLNTYSTVFLSFSFDLPLSLSFSPSMCGASLIKDWLGQPLFFRSISKLQTEGLILGREHVSFPPNSAVVAQHCLRRQMAVKYTEYAWNCLRRNRETTVIAMENGVELLTNWHIFTVFMLLVFLTVFDL